MMCLGCRAAGFGTFRTVYRPKSARLPRDNPAQNLVKYGRRPDAQNGSADYCWSSRRGCLQPAKEGNHILAKDIIFVILDKYSDWEGTYAAHAVSACTKDLYTLRTASLTREPVTSAQGYTARPNYALAEIRDNYAGIVLVGGKGWLEDVSAAQRFEPLVRECSENGRMLGAIGTGAAFLARCGLLNNAFHTGDSLTELEQYAKSAYTGRHLFLRAQAVRDGQIITASESAPNDFARAVLSALEDSDRSTVDAWFRYMRPETVYARAV